MSVSNKSSRTNQVVEEIQGMIVSGKLAPGDRLPIESELARMIGVSRGTLREGVRALSQLGVLETRQGSGTFVTELSPYKLLEPVSFIFDLQPKATIAGLQSVRRILETAAVRLATARIDDEGLMAAEAALAAGSAAIAQSTPDQEAAMAADMEFHHILAGATAHPALASLIDALSSRTATGRLWRSLVDKGAAARTIDEHQGILASVRARDPDAAAARMSSHLQSVEAFIAEHEGNL